MHSQMSRVSSKQERMMLTEQESSPTGGILEQVKIHGSKWNLN